MKKKNAKNTNTYLNNTIIIIFIVLVILLIFKILKNRDNFFPGGFSISPPSYNPVAFHEPRDVGKKGMVDLIQKLNDKNLDGTLKLNNKNNDLALLDIQDYINTYDYNSETFTSKSDYTTIRNSGFKLVESTIGEDFDFSINLLNIINKLKTICPLCDSCCPTPPPCATCPPTPPPCTTSPAPTCPPCTTFPAPTCPPEKTCPTTISPTCPPAPTCPTTISATCPPAPTCPTTISPTCPTTISPTCPTTISPTCPTTISPTCPTLGTFPTDETLLDRIEVLKEENDKLKEENDKLKNIMAFSKTNNENIETINLPVALQETEDFMSPSALLYNNN